jgi:hypothetical protein
MYVWNRDNMLNVNDLKLPLTNVKTGNSGPYTTPCEIIEGRDIGGVVGICQA